MTADLRALLGDRYVSTLRAAVLADNPDAIASAQAVGGKLGQLMYLSAVDRLDRVLTAVLPALLAERDALAAKVEAVRTWIDRRGVGVSDCDDDYMRGYRAAQRQALLGAAELRRALDEEPQP